MRMHLSYSDRAPALAGVFCLVLATQLTGCASKNPLMEEPVAPVARNTSSGTSSGSTVKPAQDSTLETSTPTGVKRFLGIVSPHRIDIQQGNFVSGEMVAQLKEGMTPAQVRFLLGTPLLIDTFHTERWDYLFRLQKGNGELTSSHVTIFFKDNRLVRFEGGDLPTEKEYISRIAGSRPVSAESLPAPEKPAPAASDIKQP
jgi:outer membrane protein assembly factor BamE